MTKNTQLIEFTVQGNIDDVNAELERRGISSGDIVTLQYDPKPSLPIGDDRASYRIFAFGA